MAFRAEVALVVVDVHLCLGVSSMTVDSFLCHYTKEGSRPFDFHESLPGVFLLPPSPCYAQKTQHLTSSHLGLRHEVSYSVVARPQLRHA